MFDAIVLRAIDSSPELLVALGRQPMPAPLARTSVPLAVSVLAVTALVVTLRLPGPTTITPAPYAVASAVSTLSSTRLPVIVVVAIVERKPPLTRTPPPPTSHTLHGSSNSTRTLLPSTTLSVASIVLANAP